MKRPIQIVAVMAMAAASWPALAQESRVYRDSKSWVEETTGTLPAAKGLKVYSDMGSVVVRGGAGNTITYTVKKRVYTGSEQEARQQFARFNTNGSRYGDTAVLEGRWTGGPRPRRISAEFTVNAPRELAHVKVETRGGSVDTRNIAGWVWLRTAGGSIAVDEIGGKVDAETAGGSVDVGRAGGDVLVKTMGGSINVTSAKGGITAETAGGSVSVGHAEQAVVLQTMGGSIQVTKCGSELKATTAGGSIEVGDVNGRVTLETSGGSIRLSSARGPVIAETAGGGIKLLNLTHGVRAQTAAGGIYAQVVATRATFTESLLETSAGDVTVYLPSDLPFSLQASIEAAHGHTIRSDFGEVKVLAEGSEWGPKFISAQGAVNGGGPLLRIRTTLGNIVLKKIQR